MRRLVTILMSLCFIGTTQGQDLTGNWSGYFIPNSDVNGTIIPYEIEIVESTAHKISAITHSFLHNNITVKANASGLHSTATHLVSIQETSFDNLKLGNNLQACLMTNYLEYSSIRDREMLQGTYVSKNSKTGTDCGGGKVYLERTKEIQSQLVPSDNLNKQTTSIANTNKPKAKLATPVKLVKTAIKKAPIITNNKIAETTLVKTTPPINDVVVAGQENKNTIILTEVEKSPEALKTTIEEEKFKKNKLKVLPWVLVGRENKLVKKIVTNNSKISIDLYDNGTIDNDTILVFDNTELIASKRRLSYKAIHLDFEFSESNNEHEVIIVAHNMGTVPPNTALVVFKDGNLRQEYFITTTDKVNAKFIFQYVNPKNPAKPGQP